MTAQPDPKQVREIARHAIGAAILAGRSAQINHAILDLAKPERVVDGTFMAYHEAVTVEYDRQVAALSWPDEQPQAERDVPDAQAAELAVEHFLGAYREDEDATVIEALGADKVLTVGHLRSLVREVRRQRHEGEVLPQDGCPVPHPQEPGYACELIIGHEGLHQGRHGGVDAKWSTTAATAAQAERDADVRAVAALQSVVGCADVTVIMAAANKVCARFAERIAALDAGEGGETT